MASSVSSWSDLPHDLLRLVIARLTSPADCARFRAVCRPWRSVPSPRRLPWILLPAGFPMDSQDDGFGRDFPSRSISVDLDNQRCIGATDSWLAVDFETQRRLPGVQARTAARRGRRKLAPPPVTDRTCTTHSYYLYNYFSRTTVWLYELDKIIGNAPKPFEVRKVLMQSPPTGLVAVMTNSFNYPIIVLRPGKGVWLPPKPQTTLLSRVIDIAFLGDKLYGITQAEDLISLRIGFGSDGLPTVTNIELVLKHVVSDHEHALEESRKSGGDYIIDDRVRVEELGDDGTNGDSSVTLWYLVESCGKLLMVKRQFQKLTVPDACLTCKVEVFEADTSTRTWLPVLGGLDGQAIFISELFSKSVSACGEVQEDSIYFIDTVVEVFNMISRTITPPKLSTSRRASCLFLPGSF